MRNKFVGEAPEFLKISVVAPDYRQEIKVVTTIIKLGPLKCNVSHSSLYMQRDLLAVFNCQTILMDSGIKAAVKTH